MTIRKCLSSIVLMFISVALNISCSSENEKILENFAYEIDDQVLDLNVEFNKTFELNTKINVPILEYGSIRIEPSKEDRGFTIGGTVNMDIINDSEIVDLIKTRDLPNGQPMSGYVERDVARLRIKASSKVYTSVYLGMEMDYMYLGLALELPFLGKRFPAGLIISQRLFDKERRPVGVVTIYGPRVENDEVLAPGGFFVMTNVSDLIRYNQPQQILAAQSIADEQPSLITGETFINTYYREKFKKPKKLAKLLKRYKKAGKRAGLID